MFTKLVSNLPFSPALVGQLGFYARRLQKEEVTRRLGLVFAIFAIIMQSFAVWQPPQQALASTENDVIPGGVDSKARLLQLYDQGSDFSALLTTLKINRTDVNELSDSPATLCSDSNALAVINRQPSFGASDEERVLQVANGSTTSTFYSRPLNVFARTGDFKTCYQAYIGTGQQSDRFAIMRDSGDVVIAADYLPAPLADATTPALIKSKQAYNLTQNKPVTTDMIAQPGDRIEYSIFTQNSTITDQTVTIEENMADVLEYAEIKDAGGGIIDPDGKTIRWPTSTITTDSTDTRTILVELHTTLSAAPHGANNPASFDCTIANSYGNTIIIKLGCPVVKAVEQTIQSLPTTGPGTNTLFGAGLLALVTYFYVRSRQLNQEVKLVRKEFHAGGAL